MENFSTIEEPQEQIMASIRREAQLLENPLEVQEVAPLEKKKGNKTL